MSLSLVKVIAQQSVNILRGLNGTDCVLRTVYSVEEVADIATSFKDAVTKVGAFLLFTVLELRPWL